MIRAGSRTGLYVPKKGMDELIRIGKNEAVYSFLAQFLERKPEFQAWETYLKQAAYLGHAKDAIALIDNILKRSNLPTFLRDDLSIKRLDAQLSADQVNQALVGYRELLSKPASLKEDQLKQRYDAAIRLAGLGRVLKQPELAKIGFGFARQALELPANRNNYRGRVLSPDRLLAELRRSGHAGEAQAVAIEEIERESTNSTKLAEYAVFIPDPVKRSALVELAGIYNEAGRSADVLRLLNEVKSWTARDLLTIIAEKDSLGTPLGLMAAKALQANGNVAAAKTTVRALIDRLPGYDPAYELFVELNGDHAIEELDKLYTLDQFQERPLIWKAIALNTTGQHEDAERTIKRAIAIDPSDGEQGRNDRMRAYTTLADILEAKGETKSALDYHRPVKAIRLSEQADELHELGLYQRAFASYRAALDEFSDAYCIQSRLAVQLASQGLQDEALKHYRRAYELMPESFGRVESHCFGCESVFESSAAQNVAEQVFTNLIKSRPTSPQAHYMLGYLRKEQGRYEEAVSLFRQAVALDSEYLNAWKHLHELGEKTYIEASERDIARLKLFDLDPRQRHVKYKLDEVTNFTSLWQAFNRKAANPEINLKLEQVYPLEASAHEYNNGLTKLPEGIRLKMESYTGLVKQMGDSVDKLNLNPAATLAQHKLISTVLAFMGEKADHEMEDF